MSQPVLDFAPRGTVRVLGLSSSSQPRSNHSSAADSVGAGCSRRKGTTREAQAAYEHALELDPDYFPVLINLGALHYGQERPEEARKCFERAIRLDPGNAKACFNLGNALHDRREYEEALILFRDAAALDPDYADAHFNLALTCEQLGLVEEAQRHWQRYLALEPTGDWAAIARKNLPGSPPIAALRSRARRARVPLSR